MGQNPANTDYRHSGSRPQGQKPFYVTQEVEVYTEQVDHLMDDLFSEVEGTLKVAPPRPAAVRRNSNPNSFNNSQSLALAGANIDGAAIDSHERSVTLQKLNTAEISLPPISRQDLLWIEPYVGGGADQPPQPPANGAVEADPANVQRGNNLLERLLWIGACTSALLAAVMWSINYGLFQRKEVRIIAAAPTGLSQEQKMFAEEIRKLLSNATNPESSRANQATSAIPNGLPNPNNLGVNGNNLAVMPISPFQMGAGASGVVQYVPVYQPPLTPIALPPVENSPNNSSNGLANPPSNATPARANSTSNNRNNGNTANPPAVQGIAPVTTAPVTVTPQQPKPTIASNPLSNTFVLVGVLDLGERSTAMFEMNGSVQSVGLGKTIGNSGWKLVKVNQQEIVLRRGKESKIVFVGQRF